MSKANKKARNMKNFQIATQGGIPMFTREYIDKVNAESKAKKREERRLINIARYQKPGKKGW
jgi:hypothetical protein